MRFRRLRIAELGCLVLIGMTLLGFANDCEAQSSTEKSGKGKATASKGDELSKESRDMIAWAAKTYHVRVIWKNVPYPIFLPEVMQNLTGVDPSKKAVEEALPALRKAMARYPRDLFRTVGLSRIILGVNLESGGVRIGGYAYPPSKSFIVEIEGQGRSYFSDLRFHHEIFHLIDQALLGQLARQDPGWARLNSPHFKGYQSGDGWKYIAARQVNKDEKEAEPGFISPYSTSALQEDKAEIFGHLMVDPAGVAKMADKDPVIRAKVERMKQLVRLANPKMDAKFFEKPAGD